MHFITRFVAAYRYADQRLCWLFVAEDRFLMTWLTCMITWQARCADHADPHGITRAVIQRAY